MAQFITPTAAVTAAFNRDVTSITAKVPDGTLESIQETHIREILGDDFYEVVLAVVVAETSTYDTLIDTYLTPIIAQWVKYYILPDVFYEIGGAGVARIPGQGRQAVPVEEIAKIRGAIQEKIDLYIKRLIQYLEDNKDEIIYAEYSSMNVSREFVTAGGFIFQLSPEQMARNAMSARPGKVGNTP